MEIAELFQKLCKGGSVHSVDLGESFQTHILLQIFVSMQPITSKKKKKKEKKEKENERVTRTV